MALTLAAKISGEQITKILQLIDAGFPKKADPKLLESLKKKWSALFEKI